ncbi:hypothetical protein EDB89DRAFT_1909496 [Lactarius sanguifluus]|nr:hypothetical protein EDB89DRAFT_1909496 [Lactarius sanguifluus]
MSPWTQWGYYLGSSKGNGRIGINCALREWSTGERRQLDFTTNTFVEVYECHIANLNRIEMERNTSYHKMMADIYQLVTNGGLDQPPPSNSVPVLDLSMLED